MKLKALNLILRRVDGAFASVPAGDQFSASEEEGLELIRVGAAVEFDAKSDEAEPVLDVTIQEPVEPVVVTEEPAVVDEAPQADQKPRRKAKPTAEAPDVDLSDFEEV